MKQATSLKLSELYISRDKENKDDVIVMNSIEKQRNNIFDKETVKKLLKSEEDIEKGRTRKATEVIKELRSQYGF